VEAVAMPRPDDNFTYCLSSQVGCRMGCVFCATGRMGIIRQLRTAEIVEQVRLLGRLHPGATKPNLVFMGMGEPFDNLDALLPALEILTHERGLGIGARRITVSTSGLIEGIRRLLELGKPVGLAISLTSADDRQRRRLMPVAGQIPLDELLEEAARYGRATRRKVTLECAIIAGDNDGPEDAMRLAAVARRGPFKINLIPLNPVEGYDGERPQAQRVQEMVDYLWGKGIVTTVRDSRGREVSGACGQLVHRQSRRAGAPRTRAIKR
jgi:23S rRNA (adenine2503-C2)-methyltransferase